ncbi:MAG: hypothetical protein GC182_09010 [Rhodopseudomonas sp.]|nr:hypothetical protein [Rhodopseudomonas sp.]
MTKFKCTTTHKDHGELTTTVEINRDNDFVPVYDEIADAAALDLASRYVDYESFGSDSDYSDRLDEVADEFTVIWLDLITDQPRQRYAIYGRYSNDESGTWSDHVEATNCDEAEFIARQTMADNERADRDDPDQFMLVMEEIEIEECYPEPVTKDEALALIAEYGKLYDGLSDMIESGRVTRADIPDDYQWLADTLHRLAPQIDKITDALKAAEKADAS